MGKRLDKELKDRGMRPVDLCEIVPALTDGSVLSDGTISAIINRDSGHSKFAPAIAKSLDLELHWLLTGEEPKYLQGSARSKNYITRGLSPAEPLTARGTLLEDWDALPEGWRFYISTKTHQLRQVADGLPQFLKDSFRTIPDESTYWQWERNLDVYIKEQLGIVNIDGYTGPEKRKEAAPVAVEKRTSGYKLPNGRPPGEYGTVSRPSLTKVPK